MDATRLVRMRWLAACFVGAVLLCGSASAEAAPVQYTLQVGRSVNDQLVVDGSSLTAFKVDVVPKSCTSGAWQDDSDASWTVELAQGTRVQISGGRFHFQGQAPATDYPPGDGSASYSVSGRVAGASGGGASLRRVISGTVSFTGGQAPSVAGCSGSYKFLAIPTPTSTGTVGGPGSTDFKGRWASFDLRRRSVQDLVLDANFTCGGGPDPTVDSAMIATSGYGYRTLRVEQNGSFSLHAYVLDEYSQILRLDLTGRLQGSKARGRYRISMPEGYGFPGLFEEQCSGTHVWAASRPAPPRPEATFQWAAVRVPDGASYRYYFYIQGLSCTNGATAVNVTVNRRHHRISCSAGQGWASGPLSPGQVYATKAQAVRLRNGRVIRRGAAVKGEEQMPPADSSWTPVTGLNGNPPSS